MKRGIALTQCLAVASVLSLGGCKIERNDVASGDGSTQVVSGSQGGDMIALVESIWDSQVVPHLRQTATGMKELVADIGADVDSAGEAHGYRPSSEGSPWNFAVSVEGTVVSAKTDTRAATADVDVTGDGEADVVLQLGPVIRGTALRDILPFVDFSSFTDQIEFAQLSRSLNTRAYETALKDLPRETLVGQRVEALGAFTERGEGPPYLVTPVTVRVSGQ
ncbi:MAG: DUF2291 family protein [Roseibium sp.]